jgi:acetyltransferase-like isoleucine patch superfamily enzyme
MRNLIARVRNRFRTPGLGMAPDAACEIQGELRYGQGCSIGTRAVLVVPPRAALELGDDVYVGRYVELGSGTRIRIGDGTTLQDRCIFVGDVDIGRYCTFSLNVLIVSGTHYYDLRPALLIRDQDQLVRDDPALAAAHSKPVRIGDDCWIGANAVILAGVTLGKGCVVGANAVVGSDVPPYTVVAGAPAKLVKERLRFQPPASLDGLAEADLPYFYSGCGLSAAERVRGKALGGMLAASEFTLAVAPPRSDRLRITARCVDRPCSLVLGGQSAPLAGSHGGVEFSTAGLPPPPYAFTVSGAQGTKWPVCIRSVESA